MSGQSSTRFSNALGQSSALLGDVVARLAQPAQARRLRQLLIALALLWLVFASAALVWALLPASEPALPENTVILNPAQAAAPERASASVDIERVVSWHLLGKADEAAQAAVVEVPQEQGATGREGIEEGARETRLDLRLRGIVASTRDGLGHAIIEYKSKQQVYAVDDKLPISGRVVLAKVMPDRVVIDNRGTYELLVLYEPTALSKQAVAPPVKKSVRPISKARAVDKRSDAQATALARNYREQLYQNPQSLAELVQISAVREAGELRGYRVAPGSDAAQFSQLGFKKGDLVTAVNGVALNDPGNTVRLYQLMRDASEAVFDLERAGERLTVTVTLDDSANER